MADHSSAADPSSVHPLILDLRAAVSLGRQIQASDVDEIEKALASAANPNNAIVHDLQSMASSIQHYLRDNDTPMPPEVFTQLPNDAKNALVTLHGLANSPMRVHPRDAREAADFVTRALLNAHSGTASFEPAALDAHGLRAMDRSINDLKGILELAHDYDLDEMQQQSLINAIETMELRKRWKAAPQAAA